MTEPTPETRHTGKAGSEHRRESCRPRWCGEFPPEGHPLAATPEELEMLAAGKNPIDVYNGNGAYAGRRSRGDTARVTLSIGGQVTPEVAAVQHLWQKRPVPPELASDQPRTIDEWLVTGDPGGGYPPYRYTWRSDEYADPEAGARAHVGFMGDWVDGPHLSHRTVTYSAWEQVL